VAKRLWKSRSGVRGHVPGQQFLDSIDGMLGDLSQDGKKIERRVESIPPDVRIVSGVAPSHQSVGLREASEALSVCRTKGHRICFINNGRGEFSRGFEKIP